MKCKKHFSDLSSSIGVCASCLRERLFALIAAQSRVEAQSLHKLQFGEEEEEDEDRRNPPPLVFPRSVSPYISRRKSDTTPPWLFQHNSLPNIPDQRFYSTPQIGPNGTFIASGQYNYKKKKSYRKFSLFSGLFRSKPDTDTVTVTDPRVSNPNDACATTVSTSTSSSSSWFSAIFSGRRKKQSRTFSLDESTIGGHRRTCGTRDRGMSPVRYSDEDEDEHYGGGGSSGYSSASEASHGWKQTPRRTPAAQPCRRGGGGGGKSNHSRNLTGMAFCLSPLVRASPSRHWNQKGMPPETAFSGEIRVPVKPHLTNAMSFCKNRSRKLADFGRFNPNH